MEELKENLVQIRLDKDTELSYKNRITSLESSKETLIEEKSARDQEILSVTQQLEELKREVANCHSQLNTRNEELAASRAISKENAHLKAKIQELESAKNTLESQLVSATQEATKAKDEISSIRKSALKKEQQVKDWEQKFKDAQNAFGEERVRYIAAKEQENKTACQELAKTAEIQNATLKLKLETETRNSEQKCKEKDMELERLKVEHGASVSALTNAKNDILQLTEKPKQALAQMRNMHESSRNVSENLFREFQSLKNKSTEIQNILQSAAMGPDQIIEAATRAQREVEAKFKENALVLMEVESLPTQNNNLQNKFESLSRALARQTQATKNASLGTRVKPYLDMEASSQDTSPLTDLDTIENRLASEGDYHDFRQASNDGTTVNRVSGYQTQGRIFEGTLIAKEPNPPFAKPFRPALKKSAGRLSGQKRTSFTDPLVGHYADPGKMESHNNHTRPARRPEQFLGAVSGGGIGQDATSNSRQHTNAQQELSPTNSLPMTSVDKKRTLSSESAGPRKYHLSNRKHLRSIVPGSQEV